jgi:hypothetical protein
MLEAEYVAAQMLDEDEGAISYPQWHYYTKVENGS